MRILFIAPRLHPNYSDAMRALSARHEVRILVASVGQNESHDGLVLEHFRSSAASRMREALARRRGMVEAAIAYRLRTPGFLSLLNTLRKGRIDLVYARRDNGPLLRSVAMACRLNRTPLITYRQAVLEPAAVTDRRAIYPLRSADTAASHPNFIPLCIAVGPEHAVAAPWRAGSGPLRIMAVGKLQERKGFQLLIAAAARLAATLPIQVDIYGDYAEAVRGANAEALRAQIAAADLQDVVRFRDFVPQDRMHGEYLRHHLYVYCGWVRPERDPDALSHDRADGLCGTRAFSLLEAMRAGLPVISSSEKHVVGAVAHGRNGLVFEKGDAADLADRIATIARADLAAMGVHSRHLVETEYDAARFPARFERMIRAL